MFAKRFEILPPALVDHVERRHLGVGERGRPRSTEVVGRQELPAGVASRLGELVASVGDPPADRARRRDGEDGFIGRGVANIADHLCRLYQRGGDRHLAEVAILALTDAEHRPCVGVGHVLRRYVDDLAAPEPTPRTTTLQRPACRVRLHSDLRGRVSW